MTWSNYIPKIKGALHLEWNVMQEMITQKKVISRVVEAFQDIIFSKVKPEVKFKNSFSNACDINYG